MSKKLMKYNEAIRELNTILEGLESERIDVDEVSLKVKRAIELIRLCREKIAKTELEVKKIVKDSEITDGICSVFCPGSTAAILLNENDPMLLTDIKKFIEKIVPEEKLYQHPDNAHSHIRSAMFSSSSQTMPVENGELFLGTWQDILFLELDVKPRDREIMITIVGE